MKMIVVGGATVLTTIHLLEHALKLSSPSIVHSPRQAERQLQLLVLAEGLNQFCAAAGRQSATNSTVVGSRNKRQLNTWQCCDKIMLLNGHD